MSQTAAIITAAGSGRRMGDTVPKQFLEIRGKPLFVYTLEIFQRCVPVDEIVVVAPADAVGQTAETAVRWKIDKLAKVVPGGRERLDSVRSGLDAVSADTEIVLVHDVVRPFVSCEKIGEIIDAVREFGAAILAVPVTDTLKRVSGERIESTLKREGLWRAQTPQGFRMDLIREAYRRAADDPVPATDDAALVERMGHAVRIVPGSEKNIKITTPEDLNRTIHYFDEGSV